MSYPLRGKCKNCAKLRRRIRKLEDALRRGVEVCCVCLEPTDGTVSFAKTIDGECYGWHDKCDAKFKEMLAKGTPPTSPA